jgi:hypothetical protein
MEKNFGYASATAAKKPLCDPTDCAAAKQKAAGAYVPRETTINGPHRLKVCLQAGCTAFGMQLDFDVITRIARIIAITKQEGLRCANRGRVIFWRFIIGQYQTGIRTILQ